MVMQGSCEDYTDACKVLSPQVLKQNKSTWMGSSRWSQSEPCLEGGKEGLPGTHVRLEKAMAPHSRTLAWNLPWTEVSGRLQSMGSLSRVRLLVLRVGQELSDFTFTFHVHALDKEMAAHSIVLAWRIPGTVEPSGLPSMGSRRVGHD